MQKHSKKTVFWGGITVILLIGMVYAFMPKAVIVDLHQIRQTALTIGIREEGKTQVHDIYTVSAPVTGRLKRITADVGDQVTLSESIVAQIEPLDPNFLDPRSEAQAKADIQAAASAQKLAEAEVSQAQAELDFAFNELSRMRELLLKQSVSERELEVADKTYKTRRAALATAQAALQMKNFESERANAAMLSPTTTQAMHGFCECLDIRAPIDGNILKILNKSEGVVNMGTPLLEIGNTNKLEVIIELLSSDAVKVKPGQIVLIDNWGGQTTLKAQVSRVEPIGFTKVSALGIEEQRVNVIADFLSPPELWQSLGHGYQVDVEIITNQLDEMLTVPIGALFREGKDWAVYQVSDGIANKQIITLGLKNNLLAEIKSGLSVNDMIVMNPSNQVISGVSVVSRDELIE